MVQTAALRANGLTVRLGPTKAPEGHVSRVLAALVDRLEREGTGLGREEEVRGHAIASGAYASDMMALTNRGQGQKHRV